MPPWRRVLCLAIGAALLYAGWSVAGIAYDGAPKAGLLYAGAATLFAVGALLAATGLNPRRFGHL